MSGLEARMIRNRAGHARWGIFRNGQRVGQLSNNQQRIEERLEAMIAAATARAGYRQRPCMCCEKTFLSEGKHNRLCDTCRTKFD